jgi:hypothetical protein
LDVGDVPEAEVTAHLRDYDANSASSAFASFRPSVSKPSVSQL